VAVLHDAELEADEMPSAGVQLLQPFPFVLVKGNSGAADLR
jgi:hypothetical protein